MKRNAIARIVLYSLLALILLSILLAEIGSNSLVFSIGQGRGDGIEVEYEASVEAESGIKLKINWGAGKVIIKQENVDKIIFRETADGEIKKPMTYNYSGNILELNHSKQAVISINRTFQKKNLIVVVPMDWYCQELEINGAGLDITIRDLGVGKINLDGAGCNLTFQGKADRLEMDGAGCVANLVFQNEPNHIEFDGAGCELSVTLPEGCGFAVDMDGLGCRFDSNMDTHREDGMMVYGNRNCKIEVDGIGCSIEVYEHTSAIA